MGRSLWAILIFLLPAYLLTGSGLAQPPVTEPELTLDDYKLPNNILVIICDSLGKAQKIVPQGAFVTPEKLQEFLELEAKVKQLENQLKPKKLKPYDCKLTGRLQSDFIEMEAKFTLVTQQANSLVTLGCSGPGVFLTKADLDGQFPLVFPPDKSEGFVVRVPKPGKHTLTLFLQIQVKTSADESLGGGIERSFTLNLPGVAALYPLELTLPGAIKELRWNDQVRKESSPKGANRLWEIPLVGDLDKSSLKLSWKEPTGPTAKGTLTSAAWDVAVHVQKKHIKTTANLTLNDPRGKPVEWQLLVPKGATVDIKGADLSYKATVEKTIGANSLVHLQGPPAQQLEVAVSQLQDRQAGKRFPVGPYLVLGADQQQGNYEIHAAPEVMQGQRLGYYKFVDLQAVDNPDDAKKKTPNVVDRFKAWDLLPLAPAAALQLAATGKIGPHFELEFKPVEAQVETDVEHTVRIQPAAQGWNVLTITKIHVKPLFGVDFLDIQLPRPPLSWALPIFPGPAALTLNPLDALAAMSLGADGPVQPVPETKEYFVAGESNLSAKFLPGEDKESIGRLDLKKPKTVEQTEPFVVTLTRKYWIAPQLQQARVELPRPVSLSDKGAKVLVEMEDEGLELVHVEQGGTTIKKNKHQQTILWNYAPEAVLIGWQPFQKELPVNITADVTFQGQQALVRQQFDFDFSHLGKAKLPKSSELAEVFPLRLAVPPGVRDLKIEGGKKKLDWAFGNSSVTVEIATKGPLVLEYQFQLPKNPKASENSEASSGKPVHLKLPLPWPEQATRAETKVRCWCGAGKAPSAPDDLPGNKFWHDSGPEEVAGKKSLPVLVLQSEQTAPALTLQFGSAGVPSAVAGVIVDRALMQVQIKDDGKRHFRARFLITRLDADALELELPVPLSQLKSSLIIQLDGKALTPLESGQVGDVHHQVRIALPAKPLNLPVILEINFDLEAADSYWWSVEQMVLQPPQLLGEVHLGRVRWQVLAPASQVLVVLGGYSHASPQWKWQGGLFAPESLVTAGDLEQWLSPKSTVVDSHPAGMVFWNTSGTGIRVVLVPHLAWLALCSALFLILVLGVSMLPWKRVWLWLLLVLLGTGVLTAGMFWPGILPPFLYGVQPGVVVLAVILFLQWLLHQRYRRQMLFLPGFTRLRQGSSIARREVGPMREKSTVDAGPRSARKAGSSRIGP